MPDGRDQLFRGQTLRSASRLRPAAARRAEKVIARFHREGKCLRHDAQSDGRIGQRTRAQTQTATGAAEVHRRGKLDKKPAGGCQAAYGKSQLGLRPRLAALCAKGFGRRRLSCGLPRQANCPSRTSHFGLPACCPERTPLPDSKFIKRKRRAGVARNWCKSESAQKGVVSVASLRGRAV